MGNLVVKTFTENGEFTVPGGVRRIRAIAKARTFPLLNGCGFTENGGRMFTWGRNSSGQIGNGNVTNQTVPTLQSGWEGFNWRQASCSISKPSTNLGHSVAVTPQGTVYVWGDNTQGQLGLGDNTNRSVPTLLIPGVFAKKIAHNLYQTFIIDQQNDLYAMGLGQFGVLGNGGNVGVSVPTLVLGGYKWRDVITTPATAGIGDDPVVNYGINLDGDLYVWGASVMSGIGTVSSPVLVGGGLKWKKVFTYSNNLGAERATYGITENGDLYAWGSNNTGQLGVNSTDAWKSSPTLVPGGLKWTDIRMVPSNAGGVSISIFGLTDSGQVFGWGYDEGQLGNGVGSEIYRSSPVLVIGGGTYVKIGATVDSVGFYSGTVLGLRNDGTIWGWGGNTAGTIGDGTFLAVGNVSSPVMVIGGHVWTDVADYGTDRGMVAVDNTGTLFTFGQSLGPVGNSTYSSPVMVVGPLPPITPILSQKDTETIFLVEPGDLLEIDLGAYTAKVGETVVGQGIGAVDLLYET